MEKAWRWDVLQWRLAFLLLRLEINVNLLLQGIRLPHREALLQNPRHTMET